MTTYQHTYNLPFTVMSKNESEHVTARELWSALHTTLEAMNVDLALGRYNDIHDICGFPIATQEAKE